MVLLTSKYECRHDNLFGWKQPGTLALLGTARLLFPTGQVFAKNGYLLRKLWSLLWHID